MMTISIEANLVSSLMSERPQLSHKGNFGSALIVAGSRHYTGAALLAGEACLKSGVGLVFMGVPSCLRTALAGSLPEAIWEILPSKDGASTVAAASLIPKLLVGKTSLLLGPGIGQSEGTKAFILRLFDQIWAKNKPQIPVVFDADALNFHRSPTGLRCYLRPHCSRHITKKCPGLLANR